MSCPTKLIRHYNIKKELIPAMYHESLRMLSYDDDTAEFLKVSRSGMCKDFLGDILRNFFSLTDVNAMLNRGQMFVLSTDQVKDLLAGVISSFPTSELRLLDVGAGNGDIAERFQPLFGHVHVTEASKPMCKRLREKGFKVTETMSIKRDVPNFADDGQFHVVSLLNLLDRCDDPMDLLKDASRLLHPDGRILIALVLPFSDFVEDGSQRRSPKNALNMDGGRCCEGATFEKSLEVFLTRIVASTGLIVERIARVPYLCAGDSYQPYYVLSDAIIVLRHANSAMERAISMLNPMKKDFDLF